MCGDRLVSMDTHQDKKEHKTTVRIFHKRQKDLTENCDERWLIVDGRLPKQPDIVETCWVPLRKAARHGDEDMQWVVMYPPKFVDGHTEIGFIPDTRCEGVNISLETAMDIMAEKLREIAQNADSRTMPAARLVEEVSMEFCEELDRYDEKEAM